MNKSTKMIIGIIVIFTASLLIYAGATMIPNSNGSNNNMIDNDSNSTSEGDVVALVNGVEITSMEVTSTINSYKQQGFNITDEEAMEQLIDQEVLYYHAQQEGYIPSDNETESELETFLIQQGTNLQDYKKQLNQQGISYEEQLQNFKEKLAIQRYLKDTLDEEDYNVTEEEAEEFYENYKENSEEEIPSYEELKSQIISHLQQQKRQEATNTLIEELRKDMDIEYV